MTSGESTEFCTRPPEIIQPPQTTESTGVVTQPPTITINPPTTTAGTTTFSTTTFGTTTFGTTTTTGQNVTWPPNKDGFTVILKSVDTSKGRTQAENAADKARANGLPERAIRAIEADFLVSPPDERFDVVFSAGFVEHFEDT